MKKLGAALLLAALTLTGCASGVAETPTPTPTVEANAEACDLFAEATAGMAPALTGDGDVLDAWEDVRTDFDTAALAAEEDVKERLDGLVNDDWPAASDVFVYVDARDEMNEQLEDIGRACEAAGHDVAYHTFA